MPLVAVRETRPTVHQITFMQLARATNVGRVQRDKITDRSERDKSAGVGFSVLLHSTPRDNPYNINIFKSP